MADTLPIWTLPAGWSGQANTAAAPVETAEPAVSTAQSAAAAASAQAATAPAVDPTQEIAHQLYRMVDAWVPESLRGSVMGIQYWQYLGAFVCILLGLVAKKISDYVFHSYLIPRAKKTKFRFDDLVLEALSKPMGWALFLLGLFGAVSIFNLKVQTLPVQDVLLQALKVAFAIDFLWFVFRMVDVLGVYLGHLAARTDSKLDDQLVPMVKKSLKVFVGLLLVVMILQNLGYNVGSLLAGLGIGGLALAMAAKDTLANLFGGIVILTDHPFRIGDWVKIGDTEGTIEQIGFRSTRIRTFPRTLVTIPNAKLVDDTIENKSKMPLRRVMASVGVTYETSADQMQQIVGDFTAILKGEEGVDQEYIVVRFSEFGDSSLNIVMVYFTKPIPFDEHSLVVERINLAVMRAIEARGLSIAFPTRTLYLEGDIARALAGMGRSPLPGPGDAIEGGGGK